MVNLQEHKESVNEESTQHIRSYPGRADLSIPSALSAYSCKLPTARPGFLFSVSPQNKKITCADYLIPALSTTDNRNLDALRRGAGQAIQVNQPISFLCCRQEANVLLMGNRFGCNSRIKNKYPKLFIGKRAG